MRMRLNVANLVMEGHLSSTCVIIKLASRIVLDSKASEIHTRLVEHIVINDYISKLNKYLIKT